jgi:hypothetical protein
LNFKALEVIGAKKVRNMKYAIDVRRQAKNIYSRDVETVFSSPKLFFMPYINPMKTGGTAINAYWFPNPDEKFEATTNVFINQGKDIKRFLGYNRGINPSEKKIVTQ